MLCRFRLVASAVPFVLTLNWLLATDIHSGLVAYYPFEGNFQDTTGNGNDGTPRGGPVFVQGVLGQALSLDGINDRVELPPVLMRDDFTVVFWMRTNQVAYDGGSWYEGISLVDGEVCGSPPGGDTGIALINEGEIIYNFTDTDIEVNDGSWHAIAVSRDQASEALEIYIDGVFAAFDENGQEESFTGMPWIGVGQNPCRASENFGWFEGQMDELRFYDRALSAAEIRQLAGANSNYYPQVFNLGSGNDTLISISNSLAVPTQVSVNCWSQSGEVTNFLVNQPLAARSQMAFRPPSEFVVGSCLVHGGVNSSATWNFDVGGNIFNVGTSPLNAGDQEVSWSFPVGFAQDGAQLGMAVHNPNSEAVECTASIYSRDQLPDFDLTQTSLLDGSVGDDFPFSVPAYGQIASFFGEPFDAAEGLLSFVKVELRCSKPVLPLVLTQNPADGFPTPIEGTPAP